MEDNIEVKDVQKTEYLDKNGLDMLWTKIKENTHNQVEVERNRAVAKENSITNSFSDFVSKTTTDDQTINSDLLINRGSLIILGGTGPEDEETEDKKREGLGLFPTLIQFGDDNDTSAIELRGNAAAGPVSENGDGYITGSRIDIETSNEDPRIQLYTYTSNTDPNKSNIGDSLTIDNRSVFIRDTNEVYSSGSDDTFEVEGLVRGANLTATCISLQDKQSNNGIIIENNSTDNYIMLSHGTNQAKYLKITGGGITCNGGSVSSGDGLFFEANGRLSDIYHTSGQMIVRQFDRLNTEVSGQGVFVGNNTADGQRGIQITGNGIQIEETTQVPVNRSSDKVFATDGSIADLTEYIKIASNITTKGFGSIRTVGAINNNIGVGDNRSNLAYIGKGELGAIQYNSDGYATESFRYTSTYGLETTNTRGYKNVKIPCDQNQVQVYKYGSNDYYTQYKYSGVQLGENNDDSNLLNTNGSYKTIGTDITPLENGKVPAEYLDLSQYAKKSEITAGGNVDDVQVNGVSIVENKVANIKPATKESLGVVKVGDGLNVTDGTISVDTTAIGTGNYIPYDETDADSYKVNKPLIVTSDTTSVCFSSEDVSASTKESGVTRLFRLNPDKIEGEHNHTRYTISSENGIDIVKPGLNIIANYNGFYTVSSSGGSFYNPVSLTKNGLKFGKEGEQVSIDLDGIKFYGRKYYEIPRADGGFINILNYVQKSELPVVPTKVSQLQNDSEFIAKSVYDEKIAALEARIVELEGKLIPPA